MSSFNVRAARKLGYREAYDERHGFPEPEDLDFRRLPRIRTVFRFLLKITEDNMMMFWILDILLLAFIMF